MIFVIISLSCLRTNTFATINVTLNNNTDKVEVKVGDTLTYTLLTDEYKFEIKDITDNEIKIKVNQYGLTNTNNLLSEDNEFTIFKNQKLELHTQTTDYQESIILEYINEK